VSGVFEYIDPGRLIDGELELIVPDVAWLDAVMTAQNHPRTRKEMPSATEISRKQHRDFIERIQRGFEAGDDDLGEAPSYHFWMRRHDADDFPIVGGIGLRLGNNANIQQVVGHIGYHVYPFARGHRFAERACRLLLPLARRHGLTPLWITCNPDNIPSRRTCERLGARLIDIVPVPTSHPLYARGEREKCRFRI
jgi:predicted acetyltransferase